MKESIMNQASKTTALNIVFDENALLKQELFDGLLAEQKHINSKFFYDEIGSQLFEKIMQLPEYYPSRTEIALLKKYQCEIAETIGINKVLIEPGAGNCEKVKYIMPALKPKCYVPIDISADFLFECASNLQSNFPDVHIHAVADDMKAKVDVPEIYEGHDKVVFYPGSTIGNYKPAQALEFLMHTRELIGDNGGLLIGVDLQKDKETLDAAYNDKDGVTALFNLNVLNHVNKLLGSQIDVDFFQHVAFYNEEHCRIEMHLECKADHQCQIEELGRLSFFESERIHTEYSYKYTIESFSQLAGQAGLKLENYWLDDNQLFSVQYYVVA
jgi:dimethylhistidine N-methyltransferase